MPKYLNNPELSKAYEDSEEQQFGELVGRFEVRVLRMDDSKETQKGDSKLEWEFVIVKGPRKRNHIWKSNTLIESCMGPLKGDLKAAGEPMKNLTQLPAICEALVGAHLLIERVPQKDSDKYYNVNIKKRIGNLTEEQAAAYEGGTSGKDNDGERIPF